MSKTPNPRAKRLRADAALLLATIVWGSSFIVVKSVVQSSPPLAFLFWRFLLAVLLILPLAAGRRAAPKLLKDGTAVGLLLAAGMVL